MSISTADILQSNVDRSDLAWDRPVELPDDDQASHLCARHQAMGLKVTDFLPRKADQGLPEWHFGTLADVIQRSKWCVLCRLIARSVSTTAYKNDVDVISRWIKGYCMKEDVPRGITHIKSTLRLRIFPEMVGAEDAFTPFDILPVHEPKTDCGILCGRLVEPDRTELDLVKTWIAHCERSHTKCERQPESLEAVYPSTTNGRMVRLLDLHDDKLVERTTETQYVALSYVWGNISVFKTLRGNIMELQQPGELRRRFDAFPRSIRDSITLTRSLGYRYLWVDSLCIIQDDDNDKLYQIQRMNIIYTDASLTIVAAGGDDADAGLPGISAGTRVVAQETAAYSDDLTLLALFPNCEAAVYPTTWNSRGWTYQERLLSRRRLFFTNNTVYFQCQEASWSECVQDMGHSCRLPAEKWDTNIHGDRRLMGSKEPHEDTTVSWKYSTLVTDYTARKMTYATDRIRGFEGILEELRKRRGFTAFLFGLPLTEDFHQAILWEPRQELVRVPLSSDNAYPLFPSWSWAGWIGAVTYDESLDFGGVSSLTRRIQPLRNPVEIEKTCLQSGHGNNGHPHAFRIHTRIKKFRLTLHDRSGALRPPSLPEIPGPYPVRFGITRETDGDSEDEWLGTILLPSSFRRRLSAAYEFIVLSDSYRFSKDELSPAASRCLAPYTVANVMMIKRVEEQGVESATIVERLGVGKMLYSAWEEKEVEVKSYVLV